MTVSIRWQIALAVTLVTVLSLAVGATVALMESENRLQERREAQQERAEQDAAADLAAIWSRAQGRLLGLDAALDGRYDNTTFGAKVGELGILEGDLAAVALVVDERVVHVRPPDAIMQGPYLVHTDSGRLQGQIADDVVRLVLDRAARGLDGGRVAWQASGDGMPVDGMPGVIVAELPPADQADRWRGFWAASSSGFIVAGGTFLGGAVVAGLVLRPLRDLEDALDAVAAGKADEVKVGGAAEFQQLARSMKETAVTVAQERERSKARVQELDTVAQRRGAELEDRDATLAALFQGISHDVKGPLISATSLMGRLDHQTDEEERQLVTDRAKANLVRVGHAVDQMVSFSRALREPAVKEVAVDEVLSGAVAQARRKARGMGRHVTARGGYLRARCDPARLEAAMQALLDNAYRYGGNVEVSWDDAEGPRIVIEDDGPGIPYPVEMLVEPYMVRANAPGAMAGMGLAIAHRMITGMGGRLDIVTGPEGTRCTIDLPGVDG